MAISLGAAKLPLRHLSIRVPWHDASWDGSVCRHPTGNASCLILEAVREKKSDDAEERVAGQSWADLEATQLPPCLTERAGFMAPFPTSRLVRHPYSKSDKGSHAHFAPTPYRHSPYAASCIPFRWMRKDEAEKRVEQYQIPGYAPDREMHATNLMGFDRGWVQVKENQLALTDTFFSAVEPDRSLCFFYSKRTPLADDTRRVIVGVGRVKSIGDPVEYRYTSPGEIKAMLWEREVVHTIRATSDDGFLLPYHALLDAAAENPSLDLSRFVAFAPEDAFEAFSYVTEHVNHDQAIAALLNCAEVLRRATDFVPGDLSRPIEWINDRLSELWRLRGPCPGIGSALTAYGIEQGTFLAYELSQGLKDNEDPWPVVEALFADPSQLGPVWQKRISATLAARWRSLPDERRALLKLLSRFNITADQARRFYQEDVRKAAGIFVRDADLLENPYLLYERDRGSADAIAIQTVDRGVFPDDVVRNAHPLPPPSTIDDPADWRRARALMVAVLERAAQDGDTLRPRANILEAVRDLNLRPTCPLTYDLLPYVEEYIPGVLTRVEMDDGEPAYQLARLTDMGAVIRRQVESRMTGKPHTISVNWPSLLAEELGGPPAADDEAEMKAREEKVAALAQLAASRISVLIGPAGTGKTTLLSVLCRIGEIKRDEVLLLAPTGKARVQLARRTGLPAQTIAQFLVKRGQYRWETQSYVLPPPGQPPPPVPRTVIVDEASMLTEEQLAATLAALPGVHRLILVGDPRQLPPIGSGRPFVDIVNRLKPDGIEGRFPRIAPGYAELTIRRRQMGVARSDLLLAEWFSGQPLDPGADQIWDQVAAGVGTPTLRFVKWSTDADLHDKLLDILVEELELTGSDDVHGFDRLLGATFSDGYTYFNRGSAEHVESWQILSPVNGRAHGIGNLNRIIQRQFHRKTLDYAEKRWSKIPEPFGSEEIVYGDKVINIENRYRKRVWPEEGALHYVANGEIGLVIGRDSFGKKTGKPRNLWVEFSSQPGYGYDFFSGEFDEDVTAPLQLAYAITIHKAQGSEFGTTFLVLPHPLPMLSRELLYTALTRQRQKVVVLHQGEPSDLKRFDAVTYSETARRLTNLFSPPRLETVDGRLLEAGLIHRTKRGDAVRSKSEVIIADQIFDQGINYVYEQRLTAPDGSFRYPDFTVDDAETGRLVYWEHLGLLHDPEYRARWEQKKRWYQAMGIRSRNEGETDAGVLVTSEDDPRGGIDSGQIESIIKQLFGR